LPSLEARPTDLVTPVRGFGPDGVTRSTGAPRGALVPYGHDVPTIFHIATAADWAQALADGEYRTSTRGRTLAEVGFIHASYEDQVARIGALVYDDVTEPLVLLVIDVDRVPVPVVAEHADGDDELFPHVHGPLPVDAVVEVRPFAVTPGA
jgi:uncharacterized protein (DUF952 family)